MKSLTFALTIVFMLPGLALAQNDLDRLPMLMEVAPGAEQISPHVPQMGEHWANPANLPVGPIYCVIEGRVVCVEYMFDAADLENGASWTDLIPGIETPPIRHIDLEFMPDGIGPRPVPLYQLHIYFVDPDFLAGH